VAENPGITRAKLVFRVSPDSDGQVYLSLDRADKTRVPVRRPITQKTLGEARAVLAEAVLADLVERGSTHVAQDENEDKNEGKITKKRRDARKEIDVALSRMQSGGLLNRAKSWVVSNLIVVPLQILLGLVLISIAYKVIQFSSENFPRLLHLAVLAAYTAVLIFGISTIATEKERQKWVSKIREWFGPRGLIIYACLLLVTSAAVFGSFTFVLYENNPSLLALPPGTPDNVSISEGRLLDFYMWHFLKLIPLLSVNEVLNWNEPVIYESSRIGFLILIFQGVVVIPTIATFRHHWKNRSVPEKGPYQYVHGAAPPV